MIAFHARAISNISREPERGKKYPKKSIPRKKKPRKVGGQIEKRAER